MSSRSIETANAAESRYSRLPRLTLRLGSALCLLLLLIGCGQQQQQQTEAKRYQLKGIVVSIDRSNGRMTINHEEIAGYMAAMTMPYPVVDPKQLDVAAPGDQITADVVVANRKMHIENIVVVKKADAQPTGSLSPSPKSDVPPNFEFVNQDGKRVQLQQYRGQAVLLTFIYTSCPLDEYCPLMSRNFASIDKKLAADPAAYKKTHLLSISFDPDHDTPEVLRNYSKTYMPKPAYDHWEFVAIPKESRAKVTSYFNLFVNEESGQITHSMQTAIIDPDGTIRHWYGSNDWKIDTVVADLTKSAHS